MLDCWRSCHQCLHGCSSFMKPVEMGDGLQLAGATFTELAAVLFSYLKLSSSLSHSADLQKRKSGNKNDFTMTPDACWRSLH